MRLFIYLLLLQYYFVGVVCPGNCNYEIATATCEDFQDIGTAADPLMILRCRMGGERLWCREEYDAGGAPVNYCCSNIRNFVDALDELEDLFNNDRFGFDIDNDDDTACFDVFPNCANLLQFCLVTAQRTTMRANCARSCNFCGTNAGRAVAVTTKPCVDNPTANCHKLKQFCQDTNYFDFMVRECPVTCDKCKDPMDWNNKTSTVSPPTRTMIICFDKEKFCPQTRSLCDVPTKKRYYRRACKRSCGYCH